MVKAKVIRKKLYTPKDIGYTYETYYVGRNGMGRQAGLTFGIGSRSLQLYPINSKGNQAHCQINIPYADIPKLIIELVAISDLKP